MSGIPGELEMQPTSERTVGVLLGGCWSKG